MASSRFPGKPLVPILGMPLILHVWHRCRMSEEFERVVVATCDEEIRDAVERGGAEAIMTAATHERATDRTEEAVANLGLGLHDEDLVVMVQGDEVLMAPDMARDIVKTYEIDRPPVVNLGSRLYRQEDMDDPNTVKVVADSDGRVLYFSRSSIPSRARCGDVANYQQTGIMAFSASFLRQFSALSPTPLEIAESVDMLRVLEHGLTVRLIRTETETIGVDVEADRDRAERLLAEDPLTARYLEDPR